MIVDGCVALHLQEKPSWERLPGGLREGGWIVVQGIPKKDRDRYNDTYTSYIEVQ